MGKKYFDKRWQQRVEQNTDVSVYQKNKMKNDGGNQVQYLTFLQKLCNLEDQKQNYKIKARILLSKLHQ